MGNCLVLEKKLIRVMKTDGKILEYQAPIEVQQVLSDLPGYVLSDSFSGFHHSQPDAKLLPGQLYYLIPVLSSTSQESKKKVSFSNPEVNDDHRRSPARIKLIISKQELQELLQKGITVQDIVSHMQCNRSTNIIDISDADGDCRGWKPVLESIAEVN